MKKQVLLLLIFLSGCADDRKICPKVTVDYPQYLEISRCWTAENGKFEGYVILSEGKNATVPFFVSKNCRLDVVDNQKKEIFSVISSGNPIFVKDLIFEDLKTKIGSNFMSHPPQIKENDIVYYLKTSFSIKKQGRVSYLIFPNIEEFSDTNATVEELFRQRDGCGEFWWPER
jgi:hypothetical protein